MDRGIEDLKRRVALGDESARFALQVALHRSERFVPEAWEGLPVRVDFDVQKVAKIHGHAVARRLSEALSYLDLPRLINQIPRTKSGDLKLKQLVFLERIGGREPQSPKEVALWLVAKTPNFKALGRVIHLAVERHGTHRTLLRWHRCPWLWDHRIPLHSAATWGHEAVDYHCLQRSEDEKREQAKALGKRVTARKGTSEDRITLFLLLMDFGQFDRAFSLFQIELELMLQRALRKTQLPSVYPSPDNCRDLLYFAAPWRFHELIERESARRKAWAKCPAALRPHRGVALGLYPFAGAPYWQNFMSSWLVLRKIPGRRKLYLNNVGEKDLVDCPLGEWQRPLLPWETKGGSAARLKLKAQTG